MALVWTVNSTLSCGCTYVMQWNLISCNWQQENCCSHFPHVSVLEIEVISLIRSPKTAKFQNAEFCPSRCCPLHSAARDGCPPSPPSRRHWVDSRFSSTRSHIRHASKFISSLSYRIYIPGTYQVRPHLSKVSELVRPTSATGQSFSEKADRIRSYMLKSIFKAFKVAESITCCSKVFHR